MRMPFVRVGARSDSQSASVRAPVMVRAPRCEVAAPKCSTPRTSTNIVVVPQMHDFSKTHLDLSAFTDCRRCPKSLHYLRNASSQNMQALMRQGVGAAVMRTVASVRRKSKDENHISIDLGSKNSIKNNRYSR